MPATTTAYLAAAGYGSDLAAELARAGVPIQRWHGRLAVTDAQPVDIAWAAVTWLEAELAAIGSIGEAVRVLRGVQRNWAVYAPVLGGRSRLVEEQLPHVAARPLALIDPAPTAPLGGFTLLSAGELLFAQRTTSAFPNGEASFVEDRTAPSRAYLKLAEAFAVLGRRPEPGELALDLGASPGGWTWLLRLHGAEVIAVDKAPLTGALAHDPHVTWRKQSAFALEPAADEVGRVRWICSDIACYPARLLNLVRRWDEVHPGAGLVCTIKLQGATDHDAIDAFRTIPLARVAHLHHNKHELTLLRTPLG